MNFTDVERRQSLFHTAHGTTHIRYIRKRQLEQASSKQRVFPQIPPKCSEFPPHSLHISHKTIRKVHTPEQTPEIGSLTRVYSRDFPISRDNDFPRDSSKVHSTCVYMYSYLLLAIYHEQWWQIVHTTFHHSHRHRLLLKPHSSYSNNKHNNTNRWLRKLL